MPGASSRLLSAAVRSSRNFPRNAPTRLFSSAAAASAAPPAPIRTLISPLSFPFLSRAIQTLSTDGPPLPSRQHKMKQRSDLIEAFESAATTGDILSSFAALESSLDETDKNLGLACLKVGQHLDSIGSDDYDKISRLGLRALKILHREGEPPSVAVAMALHLSGTASYSLKRFSDSLGFFSRASRILDALEKEEASDFDVRPVSHAVQLMLANTKTAMGRREEGLVHLKRCLALKEAIFDPDSKELGVAYRNLAEAYAAILDFKEALPMCESALRIHEKQLGQNSVEVAQDRRLLGVIYQGLSKYQEAQEQNVLSRKVMESWGMGSDMLSAELDEANIQIAQGKFNEAISTLKRVVEKTDKESEVRALVLLSMAKAFCHLEKPLDAKRCLEVSCGILEKHESVSPEQVIEAYTEISALYESVNEFENAMTLLKKGLAMAEKLPQEQHVEGNISARIGWLLLLTGKVEQAVPYLENAAERMKESFGPKHFSVGYVYNNLGAAYMEMDRPQSAAQMFAVAKDIMDVSLGPHHADSIEAGQSLANAYAAMGSYPLALEFQKRVVDAWANHGRSAQDEHTEASLRLDELKKKAFKALPGAAALMNLQVPDGNGNETGEHREARHHLDELKKAFESFPGAAALMNLQLPDGNGNETGEHKEASRQLDELKKAFESLPGAAALMNLQVPDGNGNETVPTKNGTVPTKIRQH